METTNTVWNVRKMLEREAPALKPYIEAWKGANPYDSLSRKNFNFWAMLIVVAATVIWSIFGSTAFDGIEYILPIGFFGLVFHGWKSSREELEEFAFAVLWCEQNKIQKNLIGGSMWEGVDGKTFGAGNFAIVMGPFVDIIKYWILPIEQNIRENSCFPKRLAKLRKEKEMRKALLIRNIAIVAKMFNNFQGVANPLSEAFKLASMDNT